MKNKIVRLLAVICLCFVSGCGLGGDPSYNAIIASLQAQMKPLEADKNSYSMTRDGPVASPNTAKFAALETARNNLISMKKGKVELNDKGPFGKTVLMMASEDGLSDVVEFLLSKGADANVKDDLNGTALMYAAVSGHAQIVGLLLSHGADPNVQRMGKTALDFAIQKGQTECARLLKQK